MNKELTKEESEELYNKLWLENKEFIQENMGKLCSERFELELELVDKNKEIERLNNIIKELEDIIESAYNWEGVDFQVKVNGKWTITEDMDEVRKYIQELKGSDKE